MIRAVTVALLLLACVRAQDEKPVEKSYKLLNVIWNLEDHKLRFDVAEGHDEGSKFVIDKLLEQCEIDPDEATMKSGNDVRHFSTEEAKALHHVIDTLAEYAAESFIWFQEGGGKKRDEKPERVAAGLDRRPKPAK